LQVAASTNNLGANTGASGGNNGDSFLSYTPENQIVKVVGRYKTNSVNIEKDGVAGTPDSVSDIPDDLDTIKIGMNVLDTNHFSGLIRNIRIYSDPDVEL
jgi:hypothetical protein